MARTSVSAQLAKLRKEREALDKKEKALLARRNDKELNAIVKLATSAGLTAEDIARALNQTKSAGRPNKKQATATLSKKKGDLRTKVAPKYRNPANPSQTWTGRGLAPAWAKELKATGQLNSALIAEI